MSTGGGTLPTTAHEVADPAGERQGPGPLDWLQPVQVENAAPQILNFFRAAGWYLPSRAGAPRGPGAPPVGVRPGHTDLVEARWALRSGLRAQVKIERLGQVAVSRRRRLLV